RDLLLSNRVIATWAPKPQQTQVEVEDLKSPPHPPVPPGVGTARTVPGEASSIAVIPFPSHNDPKQDVPVPERLPSGVSIVASTINGVFVSGAALTRFDHEPDPETVKSFEKYPATRILVLTPSATLAQARETWSAFKGENSGEVGVPKGKVSS